MLTLDFFRLAKLPETLYKKYPRENEALFSLEKEDLKDCAVGAQHVAFLTKEGHVCRLKTTSSFKSPIKKTNSDEKDLPPDKGIFFFLRVSKFIRS